MTIRPERDADRKPIRHLLEEAFANIEHSSQAEGAVVDALHEDGALAVSLVAVEPDGGGAGEVVGTSPSRR